MSNPQISEWTDKLEVGDEVIMQPSSSYSNIYDYYSKKVERITKTLIIVEGGRRFNRVTGKEAGVGAGSSYFVDRIAPKTGLSWSRVLKAKEDQKINSRKQKIIHGIRKAFEGCYAFQEFSLEQLEGIQKIIKNAENDI